MNSELSSAASDSYSFFLHEYSSWSHFMTFFPQKNAELVLVLREGNDNPLQYSCLEDLMDRGASWAAVYGVAQSQTRLKRLSMHACIGEGNGNPLQYSCLENPVDRRAWWATVYGVAQSRRRLKRLSRSSSSMLVGQMFLTQHAPSLHPGLFAHTGWMF